MMIKAVIFDLYNTLIPTDPIEDLVANEFGIPRNHAKFEKLFCGQKVEDRKDYLGKILIGMGLENNKENRIRTLKVFEIKNDSTNDFEGVFDMLKALKDKGIKIGLISNVAAPMFIERVHEFPWGKMFDSEQYSCIEGSIKPEPKMFLNTLEKLNVKAEETLMIGDSMADMNGAKAVGMKYLLIDHYDKYPEFEPRATSFRDVLAFLISFP